MAKDELLTAGKLAETLGISPAAVKKLLESLKIEPDSVKGPCKYYGAAALKKLQAKK
jgi:hypothetical protein